MVLIKIFLWMNENYNIYKKNTKFNVCSYHSHVHTLPKKTTWLKSSYKTSICHCFKCWFIEEKLIRKFSVFSLISAFNHPNFLGEKSQKSNASLHLITPIFLGKKSQNQIITSSQQIYSLFSLFSSSILPSHQEVEYEDSAPSFYVQSLPPP